MGHGHSTTSRGDQRTTLSTTGNRRRLTPTRPPSRSMPAAACVAMAPRAVRHRHRYATAPPPPTGGRAGRPPAHPPPAPLATRGARALSPTQKLCCSDSGLHMWSRPEASILRDACGGAAKGAGEAHSCTKEFPSNGRGHHQHRRQDTKLVQVVREAEASDDHLLCAAWSSRCMATRAVVMSGTTGPSYI